MPYASEGEAIATRLLATAGVTALVSTRVWPSKPEQDPEGDYIVFYRISGGGNKRLAARGSLQRSEWRIDCYSATEAGAEAILRQVVAAISGWSDRANNVHLVWDTDDSDEALAEDGGGGAYQVSGQTFGIWFKQG